ncbi:amidohydrolase family protein [bacterium]|nr:amidohydrolase family protein [bacterium]
MFKHFSGVIKAKWIVPVAIPPLPNGWLRLLEGRITEVGTGDYPQVSIDLGDVALLPGLVNSHTHLEFSGLETPIGYPGISFTDWIQLVIKSRGNANEPGVSTEMNQVDVIAKGLKELTDTGTLLAGEISTPPSHYEFKKSSAKLVTFSEILGLRPERYEERLRASEDHLRSSDWSGVSPHAPYSLSPAALLKVIHQSQISGRPLAMHVAESPEERELLTTGAGSMAELLQSIGAWEPDVFPWGKQPFAKLIEQFAGLRSVFLIHGNDFNQAEIQQVAAKQHITVVFCPRTHHFFRFANHPIREMLRSGLRVVLGTDSRASNPDLNLWKEVQFLLNHYQDIPPGEVLKMATLWPAEAFRISFPELPRIGAIQPGFMGQLGSVATTATNLQHLYRDLSQADYSPVELA